MSRKHKQDSKRTGPILDKSEKPVVTKTKLSEPRGPTQEEELLLIEEQREMIFDHLEITASGLVTYGMLETVLAWCLVELGVNQMFRDWVEGDLDEEGEDNIPMPIEGMVTLIKSKMSELIDTMAEQAVKEKQELSILIENSDDEPTRH